MSQRRLQEDMGSMYGWTRGAEADGGSGGGGAGGVEDSKLEG